MSTFLNLIFVRKKKIEGIYRRYLAIKSTTSRIIKEFESRKNKIISLEYFSWGRTVKLHILKRKDIKAQANFAIIMKFMAIKTVKNNNKRIRVTILEP